MRLKDQAQRLAACAIVALGLAMVLTAVRPSRSLRIEGLTHPGATVEQVRNLRERTLEAARWIDGVTLVNGALLVVLGAAWLAGVSRRAARNARAAAACQPRRETHQHDDSDAPRRYRPVGACVCGAIFVIALLLRLPGLSHSLWYDEIYTVQHFLTTNFRGIITDFSAPNNHILYTLLLKAWDEVIPAGLDRDARTVVWRLLSVGLGSLAVLAMGMMARAALGRRAMLGAMVLLAAWPVAVDVSQQLRGYALAMVLSATTTALVLRMLKGGRGFIAYAVLCVAMLYTHPLTSVVLIGHVVTVGLARPAPHLLRRFGLMLLVIAMATAQLYAVLIPDALANAREQANPQVAHAGVVDYLATACRELGAHAGPGWISLPIAILAFVGTARLIRGDKSLARAIILPPLLILGAGAAWAPLRETRFLPIVAPQIAMLILAGLLDLGAWLGADADTSKHSRLRRWAKPIGALQTTAMIFTAACFVFGLMDVYRRPIQAIREAMADRPGTCTIAVGLGAPEAIFYNPHALNAFNESDLEAILARESRARAVVLYPRMWLGQPMHVRLRDVLAERLPVRKELAGRLSEDPAIIEYGR